MQNSLFGRGEQTNKQTNVMPVRQVSRTLSPVCHNDVVRCFLFVCFFAFLRVSVVQPCCGISYIHSIRAFTSFIFGKYPVQGITLGVGVFTHCRTVVILHTRWNIPSHRGKCHLNAMAGVLSQLRRLYQGETQSVKSPTHCSRHTSL